MANKTKQDDRTRNWSLIVYPESAPQDWENKLNDLHIKWARSPLHDLDANETTGEIKKAHWHVILSFENKKSFSQVEEIAKSLNAPIPQKVVSIIGAVRYFIHLDNPDKHQYNQSDIKSFCGFDIVKPFQDAECINNQFDDIRKIIREYKIQNLLVLLDALDDLGVSNLKDFIYQKGLFVVREMLNAQYQINLIKKPKPQKEKLNEGEK